MNPVVTNACRTNMLRARASLETFATISGMAFGDGGVDTEGNVIDPSESQTELSHQLLRKAITETEIISSSKIRYYCKLTTSELANQDINEIALYGSDNNLIAIKTFVTKQKGLDEEMTFYLDDIF